MHRRALVAIACAGLAASCLAGRPARTAADVPALFPGPWIPVTRPDKPPEIAGRPLLSRDYRAYRLDLGRIRILLQPLTAQAGDASPDVVLQLPTPDGKAMPVRLRSDPGSSSAVSLFSGRSVEGGARVLAEFTSSGFHAVVVQGCDAAWYVEPFTDDEATYLSYVPLDSEGTLQTMACAYVPAVAVGDAPPKVFAPASWAAPELTLRIAVSATKGYITRQKGEDGAVAAIQSSLHRVSDILRREFAITLVPLTDALQRALLKPAAQKELTEIDARKLAAQNAAALKAAHIPGDAYDLAHVVFGGQGGWGEPGAVCGPDRATGASGTSGRTGDPFDVDMLVHEIGHQLGARHTHNLDGYKDKASAFEPGTGSTIMGYPGLSKQDNLQLHADAYFHGDSLSRIATVVPTRCGAAPSSRNRAPVIQRVDAPAEVLAGQTFSVQAVASDPDGDTVLFAWEQVDRGEASNPATRPLFRSWCPVESGVRELGVRTQPLAADLRSGEELPSVPRALKFLVTVRDGKGGVATAVADVRVQTTAPAAWPFVRPR